MSFVVGDTHLFKLDILSRLQIKPKKVPLQVFWRLRQEDSFIIGIKDQTRCQNKFSIQGKQNKYGSWNVVIWQPHHIKWFYKTEEIGKVCVRERCPINDQFYFGLGDFDIVWQSEGKNELMKCRFSSNENMPFN